jgi:hypothetical protein
MLTHTHSPWTRYLITHKSDQSLTLDGNFNIWRKDNVYVSLYANSVLKQETKQMKNKLHLRLHHEDNKIVSVGVEDWNCCPKSAPETISAWGIWGFKVDQWRPFVGIHGGYGLNSKKLAYHKYLLGLKQRDWSLYTQVESKRVFKDLKDSWSNEVSVLFDQRVNKDLKVSADLKANVENMSQAQVVLVGEYKLDGETALKARVANDSSLTLSLTKSYRQLLNLCLVTKIQYVAAKVKTGETGLIYGGNLKYKFGVLLELNDTLV